MYYRPNALKGKDLKIHNMLISMATPENHEVMHSWSLFNIIYIIRTNEGILKFCYFMVIAYLFVVLPHYTYSAST